MRSPHGSTADRRGRGSPTGSRTLFPGLKDPDPNPWTMGPCGDLDPDWSWYHPIGHLEQPPVFDHALSGGSPTAYPAEGSNPEPSA